MAYPTISAPYGLKPVNLVGGRVYSGSTRMFPINSGYANNINTGDVVQINTDGTLIKTAIAAPASTGQAAVAGTIGVFVGCEYTSSNGPIYGKNRYQNWATGTVASDAIGYVVDDPFAVYRVTTLAYAASATNTTLAAFGQVYVGSNVQLVTNYSATTPASGDSSAGVCAASSNAPLTTIAGTAPAYTQGGPFRIVQVVPDTVLTATTTIPTGGTTSTSWTVASATGLYVGMGVSGTGVAGNYVTAISGTSITFASTFVATNGQSLTFTGYPEVLVTWNFGYHSYMNPSGV